MASRPRTDHQTPAEPDAWSELEIATAGAALANLRGLTRTQALNTVALMVKCVVDDDLWGQMFARHVFSARETRP